MARADKATTKPQQEPERGRSPRQPGAQGAGRRKALDKAGNADEAKLKDNQKQLQVGRDHKTSKMRKQQRGTYP